MDMETLKLECLKLAASLNDVGAATPDAIVEAAKKFWEFVTVRPVANDPACPSDTKQS